MAARTRPLQRARRGGVHHAAGAADSGFITLTVLILASVILLALGAAIDTCSRLHDQNLKARQRLAADAARVRIVRPAAQIPAP